MELGKEGGVGLLTDSDPEEDESLPTDPLHVNVYEEEEEVSEVTEVTEVKKREGGVNEEVGGIDQDMRDVNEGEGEVHKEEGGANGEEPMETDFFYDACPCMVSMCVICYTLLVSLTHTLQQTAETVNVCETPPHTPSSSPVLFSSSQPYNFSPMRPLTDPGMQMWAGAPQAGVGGVNSEASSDVREASSDSSDAASTGVGGANSDVNVSGASSGVGGASSGISEAGRCVDGAMGGADSKEEAGPGRGDHVTVQDSPQEPVKVKEEEVDER